MALLVCSLYCSYCSFSEQHRTPEAWKYLLTKIKSVLDHEKNYLRKEQRTWTDYFAFLSHTLSWKRGALQNPYDSSSLSCKPKLLVHAVWWHLPNVHRTLILTSSCSVPVHVTHIYHHRTVQKWVNHSSCKTVFHVLPSLVFVFTSTPNFNLFRNDTFHIFWFIPDGRCEELQTLTLLLQYYKYKLL